VSFRSKILSLLEERGPGKTICQSELLPEAEKQITERMDAVRKVAVKMALEGVIEITQKGRVVDPENFRGPIRLRLKT
jgi:hypothetical protein